jgi:hypothetical protein
VYNIVARKKQGLAALPNPEIWSAVRGLVMDGARFTQSMGQTKGSTYRKVPDVEHGQVDLVDAAAIRPEDKSKPTKSKGGKARKEKSKEKKKEKKSTRGAAGKKSVKREASSATEDAAPAVDTAGVRGFGGQLREQREEVAVHSSQAKVKVISLIS